MKKLFSWGLIGFALLVFTIACTNPLVGSDGEDVVVSDFSAATTETVDDVTSDIYDALVLSWTEPDSDFATVKITYSATNVDEVEVSVDQGTETLKVEDLTAGTEYTFNITIVTKTGIESGETVTITATPISIPPATLTSIVVVGDDIVDGTDYAIPGSDNFLSSAWSNTHLAATAADGMVTFTINGELDTAILDEYQFKIVTSGTWTTVGSLGDDNLTFADLTITSGESYTIYVDTSKTGNEALGFNNPSVPYEAENNTVLDLLFSSMDTATGADISLGFYFKNFSGAADVTADIVGAFTNSGWTPGAYAVNFDQSGNAFVKVPGQTSIDSILFRLSNGSWGSPTGIDYTLIEPNAWNDLDDDHAYDSGDSNWAIGNSAEAKPASNFVLGNKYIIIIDQQTDSEGNATRAKMSIATDGSDTVETVWQ